MHEAARAQSVVEIVDELARRERFAKVRTIRLEVGALSHVVPEALEVGLEVATKGTVADGAAIVFDRPAGTAYCTRCAKGVTVASRAEPCPECGQHEWVLVGGDELRVVDLEVE